MAHLVKGHGVEQSAYLISSFAAQLITDLFEACHDAFYQG
jgi:hypothetical protein